MSTLLTPIITQMELDRDRFKDLVNGDETLTVSLENRTEKSISGQVKDRIEAMAVDLTTAVSNAESAATIAQTSESLATTASTNAQASEDSAFSYMTAAEGARDLTLTYKNDAETAKNISESIKSDVNSIKTSVDAKHTDVQNWAGQVSTDATATQNNVNLAQQYKNDAESASLSANTSLTEIRDIETNIDSIVEEKDVLGAAPIPIYPKSLGIIDQTNGYFVASAPITYNPNVSFDQRTIYVEQLVSGSWTNVATSPIANTDWSPDIDLSSLNSTGSYRWYVVDRFSAPEKAPSNVRVESKKSDYVEFSFGSPETASEPSISVNSNSIVSVSGYTFSDTPTSPKVTYAISDENGFVVFDKSFDITQTIDLKKILQTNGDYTIHARVDGSVSSRWSSFNTTFNNSRLSSLEVDKRDVDDIEYPHTATTTVIDTNTAKAFTVDRTASPSLSLSSSTNTNIYIEVFVYVVGTTGTVTWPGSVSWDTESVPGGAAPTDTELGANWTVVALQKFDSDWVGRIVAKG